MDPFTILTLIKLSKLAAIGSAFSAAGSVGAIGAAGSTAITATTTVGAATAAATGVVSTGEVVAGLGVGAITLGTSAYVIKKIKELEDKFKDAEIRAENALKLAEQHKCDALNLKNLLDLEKNKTASQKDEVTKQSVESKSIREASQKIEKQVADIESISKNQLAFASRLEAEANKLKNVASTYRNDAGTDDEKLRRLMDRQEALFKQINQVVTLTSQMNTVPLSITPNTKSNFFK